MQIHEITTATHKIPKLNEALMDLVRSIQDKDDSMKGLTGAQREQRFAQNQLVKQAADTAYSVWATYINGIESQITDPVERKAFDDRTDGLYKKYLMAFVQQNLLGSKNLSQIINKEKIIGLVDEISKPMTPAATPYAINTAAKPKTGMQQIASPTAPPGPAKNIITRTATPNNPNAVTEAAPAVSVPGAKPKTAMQQIAAPTAPAAPAKNITARRATPNNPNQAAPALAAPAAAASPGTNTPAKQKEDFEKLVFATAASSVDSEFANNSVNPVQFASQLRQIGKAVIASNGSTNVKTTGNASADNVLKLMGLTPA